MLAYLDANSGSLIAGAIAAGAAGFVVLFKTGFHRLAKPFKRRSRAEEPAPTVATGPEEA